MPRVMFSTPEATPAWLELTEPMIVALFGGVNAPIPTPTIASSTRKSQVAGRRAARTTSPPATQVIPPTVNARAPM